MRRFILFASRSFYCNGGAFDMLENFETLKECQEKAVALLDEDYNYDWAHVLDIVTGDIIVIQEGYYCGKSKDYN